MKWRLWRVPKEGHVKRAFGYTRLAQPSFGGISLAEQRQAIRQYWGDKLKKLGFVWAGVYEDAAKSGALPLSNRPAGAELLLELESGDAVIISSLERGFHSL